MKNKLEATLFANEILSGPEEWITERDKELESMYDRLHYANKTVDDFVENLHINKKRLDDSTVYSHVLAVADSSEKIAYLFFSSLDLPNEIRYSVKVCKYSALLHEAMPVSGKDYESIVFMTDKAVADCVSALTPCLSDPFLIRLESLVNKVNRCGPHAQIIKLADLLHDGAMYDKLIDEGGVTGLFDSVSAFVVELEHFHKTFVNLKRHAFLDELTNKFYPLLTKLYDYMKKIDGKSVRRAVKAKAKNRM